MAISKGLPFCLCLQLLELRPYVVPAVFIRGTRTLRDRCRVKIKVTDRVVIVAGVAARRWCSEELNAFILQRASQPGLGKTNKS